MSKPPGCEAELEHSADLDRRPSCRSVHQPARPSSVVSAVVDLVRGRVLTPTLCRMSTMSYSSRACVWSRSLRVGCSVAALDRLGDPLDAPQPGVPGRADRGQLGDRAGELGLVDPVAPLASGRRDVDQADAVEHAEVLRDRLPGHRQLLAEAWSPSRRRRPAAGRASAAGSGPRSPTRGRRRRRRVMAPTPAVRRTSPRRGTKWSQPADVLAVGCSSSTAASQPRSRKPVSVSRSRGARRPTASSSKVTSSELLGAGDAPAVVGPAEREQPGRVGVDHGDRDDRAPRARRGRRRRCSPVGAGRRLERRPRPATTPGCARGC